MAEFRVVKGSFSVTPEKSIFAPGENVILNIKCTVERQNGWGAFLTWTTDYRVYSNDDELLGQSSRQHSMAPWTELDTARDDFALNIGPFTSGKLDGYVTVNAHG